MKSWLLLFLLVSSGLPSWRWLLRVRDYNAAQALAQAAVAKGRTTEAVYYYQQAVGLAGRGGPPPALLLDLAQAQEQAGQIPAARATYGRLLAPAVPTALGSLARQQLAGLLVQQRQVAQAIALLRQALTLDPSNATARYNYELLSQYLASHRPDAPPPTPAPAMPPPPPPHRGADHDSTAPGATGRQPQSGEKAGNDHPGEAPDASAPPPPGSPTPAPQPNAEGQPDAKRPAGGSDRTAAGSFRPGPGEERPLPSGPTPGTQRGLGPSAPATGATPPAGPPRPGTDAATDTDLQLQTQRERLKAMNLTPAQAQQLLETLRASEQQYLQQRPRLRHGSPPPPGRPTW